MSMASSSVLCLPRNRVGRDFIVGDVAGAFDQIFQAMQDVDFDPSRDRLISVGHLLAGQTSLTSCIRFLRTPSVFAVLSNGEQDLIDLFAEGPPDDEAVEALAALDYHGMTWLAGAGQLQRTQLVAAMRLLPLAISIGDVGAPTGYVHAGLPQGEGWEEFTAGLRRGEDHCVWAALRGAAGDHQVAGVERVFVCYTPEWDLTHSHANIVAVAPGPVLRLISDMMAAPKLVEGRESAKI
jgi:serine/threonine protein phosphatase 1